MNILPSCLCASCSDPSPGQPACTLLPCYGGHPVAVLLILVGFSHGVGMGRTANLASMRPMPIFFTPRRLAKSEHAQCSFPHQASTNIPLAKTRHTSEPSGAAAPTAQQDAGILRYFCYLLCHPHQMGCYFKYYPL